jgi:hypothetical protein
MHQKSNGSTSRLQWISQILDVVAICDHTGFFSLRELEQKVAGDQRSQNTCEKSSRKHIPKLVKKKTYQHKFEFF